MEWLLENLKLVIFVIVIVVYAFKAMRGQAESEGGDAAPTRRTMPGEEDAAEAERTRQIQEEIRRRILARQRGEEPQATPPPLVVHESPSLPPPVPVQPAPTFHQERDDPYEEQEQAAQAAREAAVLEQQRAFEEQLRQVRLAREAAMAGVPRLASATATVGSARRVASVRRGLREDLAGRGSLRRAIVLREVLGEPVALRTGSAGMTRR